MRTAIGKSPFLTITLLTATLAPALTLSGAPIVTNWVAYNDHRPGPLPRTNAWGTALRVTPYDMRVGPGANLTNFLNGQQLNVTMTVTANGAPDDFGTTGSPYAPDLGTPAAELFFGIVDVGNTNSVIGVRVSANTFVTLTFNGLNPDKHYVFRGTSARGGGYLLRWTVAHIIGADSFIDAHLNGTGPGVITSNDFPNSLVAGQAAYNSGDNRPGAVVGWDFISPGADGSFSVVSSNYAAEIPGGGTAVNNSYGYAIAAILLAEVEASPAVILTNPPTQVVVEQNRPIRLSVVASGTPLFYQWYKEGVGALPGATFPTFTIPRAALTDAGDYYVVISNPLADATSTPAHVTVNPDDTPPGVNTAFSYPSFDPITRVAALNQVIVEFNEAVQPASATDMFGYQLSDNSGPTSVILTNDRTVVLTFAAAQAEDTDYTVRVTGVLDLAGNNISNGGTNNPAPFHTWMQGPGNGLLFEAFDAGTGVTVDLLTNSPVYPNNPSFQTNLWGFDSRIAYPDDSHDNYGSRIRGVFIPPVSGDWRFFLRAYDRGELRLNRNGLAASGAQMLVAEVTGNDPRDWNKLISEPINLRAGQPYYIESLDKAGDASSGAGTDFIKAAARPADAGLPALGVPGTDIDTNALMGAPIVWPYAPRDLGGPLTIVQQPADVPAEATHTASFSVQVTNPFDLPIFYQWFRDGAEIPGANGRTYSFRATLADSGATFSVRAAKAGSVVTSRTATLTVAPDVTPPTVVAVHGSAQMDRVIVSFSEPVAPGASEDPFSYGTDGTFSVNGAAIDATGTNVILTLGGPLTVGGTYTLTVSFVTDFVPNTMVSTNVTIRAWVASRGFSLEQLYFNIGTGTLITDLTGNPKYPNSPDVVTWVPTLEGPTDTYDSYGTRLTGWIAPPIDGSYLFYMCSDDAGNFLLSPDDNPANVALIAQETSYNAARIWTGDRAGGTRGTPPSNISTNPIAMIAGQRYAFEALSKDGTGGDNLGVTWQLPVVGVVPADGSPAIPGAYLYALADPVGASVTITQQPVNFTGTLPGTATFSVGAASTVQGAPNTNLFSYLWQQDSGSGFADISGGYGSTLTVNLTQADVGAAFRVLVFSPGASATSQVASVSAGLRVSIARQGNVIRVSWPLPGTGVTLERTPTLQGNPPPWSEVPPNTYLTDANSVYVEINNPVGTAFYRLRQ